MHALQLKIEPDGALITMVFPTIRNAKKHAKTLGITSYSIIDSYTQQTVYYSKEYKNHLNTLDLLDLDEEFDKLMEESPLPCRL